MHLSFIIHHFFLKTAFHLNYMKYFFIILCLVLITSNISAQTTVDAALKAKIDADAAQVISKVITWRRDFHQNPELSNRETRTSKIVADHLKSLGLEVRTGIAKTGVVGILRGGKPGPTIAFRADMDALPVTERVDVPFKSVVRTTYNKVETGVMHACGHDGHTAILMGAAEVLSKNKNDLSGTFVFIFQPAEEGSPIGEEGGAHLMIKEGVLENPKSEAIFGLHLMSNLYVGTLNYKSGGTMASSDRFEITVTGKQSHGGNPWLGIDPIVTSAHIIVALQTIVSRMTPLTHTPAVITVGMIQAGNRENLIPEKAKMLGTIRCLDAKVQFQIHEQIKRIATDIAHSQGATADVFIETGNPVTYNDPSLVKKMLPSLAEAVPAKDLHEVEATTIAEDFAAYQKVIPGFFFFLGGLPLDKKVEQAPPHHTSDFFVDESGFISGVKAFCHIAVNYKTR